MARKSAGVLVYRKQEGKLQVLIAHPGGPFFKNKDAGVWSIPKGEFLSDEDPLAAAKREFEEETGFTLTGNFIALQPVTLKSGKIIYAWCIEQDIDSEKTVSNFFEMEWPPKSGRMQSFPEIDRTAWFDVATAKQKLNPGQVPFIDELDRLIQMTGDNG